MDRVVEVGRRLVITSETGELATFDLEMGSKAWETKLPGSIASVAAAEDGRHMVTGNGDGTCYVLRVPDLLTRPTPDCRVNIAAERKAAEWLASFPGHRCSVTTLDGRGVRMSDGKVPHEPFYVHYVNLQDLDINNADLAHLAGGRRIDRLSLAGNPKLTDGCLKHLSNLHTLAHLHVHNTGIGDGLADLLQHSPDLLTLDLRGSKATNACLSALKDCQRLRELYLPGGDAPFDLANVARYCPNLTYLNIPSGSRISSAGAIAQLLRLKTLLCDGKFLAGPGGEALGRASNLESLHVFNPNDAAVANLARIPGQLRKLELDQPSDVEPGLTKDGFRFLADVHGLESLYIKETKVSPSDEDLLVLAGLQTLRSLRLYFPDDNRRYTDAGIAAFRAKRPDVKLNIDGVVMEPRDVDREVAEWALSAGGTGWLKVGNGEKNITEAKDLPDGPLTVVGIHTGHALKISGIDLKRFQGLTHIQTLVLNNSSQVTDAGVEHLKNMTGLVELSLGLSQLSDQGLLLLKDLPGLHKINLFNTRVTGSSLGQLAWLYPHFTKWFSVFCMCNQHGFYDLGQKFLWRGVCIVSPHRQERLGGLGCVW